MIICHCRVVSDRAAVAAIDEGARTLAQVCQVTGAGRNCGACVSSVKQILCHRTRAQQPVLLEVADAGSQPAHRAIAQ